MTDESRSPAPGVRGTRAAAVAALLFMAAPAASAAQEAAASPAVAAARAHWATRGPAIVRELAAFSALPNVARDGAAVRRAADTLVAMMARRGLSPRLLESEGSPPAVYGEWLAPGATRTIVLYAHYDGQPVDSTKWTATHPWRPTLRTARHDRGGTPIALPADGAPVDPEWRLYGRSTADDRGGVVAILAAIDALRAAGQAPRVNVKLFFEGEEEAGSPHLAALLDRHRAALAADAWVMIDGPVHLSGRRQVVFGVRGDVNVDLTVYGPVRPLHSGHYGNWAPNPATRLARLLASMHDARGRVLVRGWYSDVVPLGAEERRAIAAAPAVDSALRRELGIARADGGGRTLAALINEPSLNVNGIASADVGALSRNVIPTTASAALDLRLVRGNDHRRQVRRLADHVRAQGYRVLDRAPTDEERRRYPLIATLVARPGGYDAERTPMSLPAARAVVAAVQAASRDPVVRVPTLGGSLPLAIFRQVLGAATITVPIANPDNNQHAEDENLRLGNLRDGIEAIAAIVAMEGWR